MSEIEINYEELTYKAHLVSAKLMHLPYINEVAYSFDADNIEFIIVLKDYRPGLKLSMHHHTNIAISVFAMLTVDSIKGIIKQETKKSIEIYYDALS